MVRVIVGHAMVCFPSSQQHSPSPFWRWWTQYESVGTTPSRKSSVSVSDLLGVQYVSTSHCHTTKSIRHRCPCMAVRNFPSPVPWIPGSLAFICQCHLFTDSHLAQFAHLCISLSLLRTKRFYLDGNEVFGKKKDAVYVLLFIIVAYHESTGWFSICLLGSGNYLQRISLIGCCNFCFLLTLPPHTRLYSSPLYNLCLWTRGFFHSIAYLSCG